MNLGDQMADLAGHVYRPEREPCGLCGDTGWAQAATASGTFAVVRCRCSKGNQGGTEHPGGCSCRTCYYGPERAGAIAFGVDGFHRGALPDPLAKPPLVGYTPGGDPEFGD